ncbi:MAG TPA: ABC transporter ATP-binding protein [Xanthobacteraceae bacterium]|jgi:ATP-binding cassette subfamily B protein|nr:ABC transporter ATP-binding protein [Xanthobacteraceae bacterium]
MLADRIKYRLSGLFGEDARAIIPRLLASEGRRYAPRYFLALIFMLLVAGSTAFSAYLMKDVVNKIFVEGREWAIWALGGTLIALAAVKGFSAYGQAVTLGRIGNRIIAGYQKKLYDNLLAQGVPFFSERHSAEFLNRLNSGANGARAILEILITTLGRDLVTLIGLIIVMVIQDSLLAFICLVAMPIAVGGVRSLIRRTRNIVKRQFIGAGNILQTMQETIQGIRVVKSFNLENLMKKRMDAHVEEVESAMNKMVQVSSRSSPLMEMLGGFAVAGAVMYAGLGVLKGGRLPGEFFSVITALLLAYEPAKRLARVNIDLAANLTYVRFLFDVIDSPPAEAEAAGLPALKVESGRIEFRDVDFGYRPDEPVLRKFSCIAEPGETTALVGPSGGGKSTVMALLERFYEPQSGSILIDGQEIAKVSRRSLRDAIAYVSQDVFLFSGTIRENIAFGHPDASESDIVAAAKAANAHEFITGFSAGYDTPVGEHGAQLSGGQRARIAIARAFLKNAPILLLDEPTAALDSESEVMVQRAIDALRVSRTTLVIAHRLQTVLAANRILVLEHGKVVESGKHDELVGKRGRYFDFYQVQFNERRAVSA